jgi:iron(III) transport system substrate-binding protein
MRALPICRIRALFCALLGAALSHLAACQRSAAPQVVVYCAHDREFAEPILQRFTKQTGIRVLSRYDTEANKSVGLYEDLIREAPRPRCDVHWNNEILATIRLQERGVLQPYDSPAAAPFPARFKAEDHTWTAFAARARVLLVNTEHVSAAEMPAGLWDLTEPRWRGRIAMAKPQFGTTATQAACLFEAWGDAEARSFYEKLRANDVQLVPGNKQVAVGVGAGQFDVGLTDTDDAQAEIDAGRPGRTIFPDRDAPADSKRGVLFIPNTVALIRGCPNGDAGRRLIDYLLRPEVEVELARSPSRQIPLNPQVPLDSLPPLVTPRNVRALPVDFRRAAQKWKESQEFLVREFGPR